MGYNQILFERAGDVAIIRLNNPAKLNAIDLEMADEISSAVDDAANSARALLLTAEGGAFCAGANLNGDLGLDPEDGLPDAGSTLDTHINPLMLKLRSIPIPFITAIPGAAAGVGCSLALAADLIIAAEKAYFLQAFCHVGLVPDGGSSWLISRAVGRARAMEMMLLGERIPASKALDWGLVNRVVSNEALQNAALDLATALAAGPTRSLGLIRCLAWAAADLPFEQSLATERQLQRKAGRTLDHQEGVAAFLEKRKPSFTGR